MRRRHPTAVQGTASSSTVELEVNLAEPNQPVAEQDRLRPAGSAPTACWANRGWCPGSLTIRWRSPSKPGQPESIQAEVGAKVLWYPNASSMQIPPIAIKFDMDAMPFVTVLGNERIQDMTLADIDRDRVPDLVILTQPVSTVERLHTN